MRTSRHQIGVHQGIKYTLIYDQMGNQQACDVQCIKTWRWYLWISGEFVGDFKTKSEATNIIIDRTYS